MVQFKALVAMIDDAPRAGDLVFAPGSIVAASMTVPVTRDFDPRLPPVGRVALSVEGNQVMGHFEIATEVELDGLFPALGGRSVLSEERILRQFEVIEVSLCTHPNQDPRIPALQMENT